MSISRWITPFAAAAALATAFAAPAAAQDWPGGKTVQIVVPAPGGGGTGDTIARVIAEELAKHLKTSVIIDNKPGANGNIGAAYAAQQAPDGFKLLFSWAGTLAVNPSLYKNLSYDAQKDFVPIVLIADVPNILVVNNDLPAKNLAEFIAYAKANPGKLNYGSTGVGSGSHLAMELFMQRTGIKMTHVPFRGAAPLVQEIVADRIDIANSTLPSVLEQINGGALRALALASPERNPRAKDIPTLREQGVSNADADSWAAFFAPAKTPDDVLDKLSKAVIASLNKPETREAILKLGFTLKVRDPAAFKPYHVQEIATWKQIIAEAGVKPE